jgi:hypothetical protein
MLADEKVKLIQNSWFPLHLSGSSHEFEARYFFESTFLVTIVRLGSPDYLFKRNNISVLTNTIHQLFPKPPSF